LGQSRFKSVIQGSRNVAKRLGRGSGSERKNFRERA